MKLLIWGTGGISRYHMKADCFAGHEIVGFVDTYKKEELFWGYPVYFPDEIFDLEYDMLIICVFNGKESILQFCINNKLNLGKVYFVGAYLGFEGIDKKYIDQLMEDEKARKEFPVIFRIREEKDRQKAYYNNTPILDTDLEDTVIIDEVGRNHVIVWMPIELIFSEKTADTYLEEYGEEWLRQNKIWENLPIISFKPYRNLYHFFMDGREYPFDYCSWYQNLFISRGKNSGLFNEQLIEKRYREYKIMQQELNKGMSFFIQHPAAAKWNDKGYFNLIDGHHRTTFLYYSGMTQIPVQITKHDYKLWCNDKIAQSVHDIILKQKRTEFYQPILNPYFITKLRPYREECSKSRLHQILEFFNEKRVVGKKVIDIGANLGYMGQAFCRMGAEVTLIEPDSKHYELAIKMNELLYTNCKVVTEKFEEYETKETYDIAICLTVFYHYFHKEEIRDAFINCLNERVTQMLIWESGDEPEEEKNFILNHTKFKIYRCLCYTYATGRFRELGIFMINDTQ